MTTPGEPVPLTMIAPVWTDPWATVAELVLYTGLVVALLVMISHFAWLAVRPHDDGGDD